MYINIIMYYFNNGPVQCKYSMTCFIVVVHIRSRSNEKWTLMLIRVCFYCIDWECVLKLNSTFLNVHSCEDWTS